MNSYEMTCPSACGCNFLNTFIAALIALALKQIDSDCREGLRNHTLVLHTVEFSGNKEDSRVGLLIPDYSEKSQGRRVQDPDGKVTAEVKVGVHRWHWPIS